MEQDTKYYVVKKRALPEVLVKVVKAKQLLESDRRMSVQKALDKVQLSRSSFYKYRDDIAPFHENTKGTTITFVLEMRDEPGILSKILSLVAEFRANILTIHQSLPVNGTALITMSVKVLPTTRDVSKMLEEMEQTDGIQELKILAKE